MSSYTLKKSVIYPEKIVLCSDTITGIDTLLTEKTLQPGLSEKDTMNVNGKGSILLDFGKELCGSVRIITIDAPKNTVIHVCTGESVNEALSHIGEKGSCNDHAIRDSDIDFTCLSDLKIFTTGFRFARIDFPCGGIKIKNIVAECEILESESVYEYNGNDELIKNIFSTAKRTVDLCASSGLVWDGVKRDRLVWIGDMHPEMLALTTLYGRIKVIEDSLDFVKNNTPLPEWMNNMPSYSVWWMIILSDYFDMTDCKDYILKQKDYLIALLNQIDTFIDESGEMHFPGYFVDWPTHDEPDEKCGVRALNIIGQQKAKHLLEEMNCDSSICDKIINKLKRQNPDVKYKKQVVSLKYIAWGEISDSEKKLLLDGGAKGMSTFMSYYILKAVTEIKDKQTAIDMMKDYYGAMLEKGATTFWEDFNMDWVENSGRIDEITPDGMNDIHGDYGAFCYKGFRHSLCHGWSSGVIAYIKEHCE